MRPWVPVVIAVTAGVLAAFVFVWLLVGVMS